MATTPPPPPPPPPRATRRSMPPPLPLLLLGVVVFTAFLVAPGAAMECWVCRSDNDRRCADPFDNSTMTPTNCSQVPLRDGVARFCSKMRSEVNGKTVYFRSCSDKEGLCPNVEHAGFCSTCKKDNCNGADRPGGHPPSAAAFVIVATAATALAAAAAGGGGAWP